MLMLWLFLFLQRCTGDTLHIETSSDTFSTGVGSMSVVYDSNDTIYVLGGEMNQYGGYSSEIYLYRISQDRLTLLKQNLTFGFRNRPAEMDEDGNIFIIGGSYMYTDKNFQRYTPHRNEMKLTCNASIPVGVQTSIIYKNKIYIFGTRDNRTQITLFDPDSEEFSVFGYLPESPSHSNRYAAVRIGPFAYVFGLWADWWTGGVNLIVKMNMDTQEMTLIPYGEMPTFEKGIIPSIVSDGTYIYIIGGIHGARSIIRWSPETYKHDILNLDDRIGGGYSTGFLVAPGALFIHKLNQIYLFGGEYDWSESGSRKYSNRIQYIDLDPTVATTVMTTTTPTPVTTPEFFSCRNRTNGMYPYPQDCERFIGCLEGQMEIYRCPTPLLFDPEREMCNFPQHVDCSFDCINKPNGRYPVPNDCHSFYTCPFGKFYCPLLQVFDPIELACKSKDNNVN